jgi:hypothetical protein
LPTEVADVRDQALPLEAIDGYTVIPMESSTDQTLPLETIPGLGCSIWKHVDLLLSPLPTPRILLTTIPAWELTTFVTN